ncbi:MAG: D-tyrosyl-tRNA(Tyr) deacylase [Deltaproteobacteria bacterium]|nr:D-tyrosyl-tRNA(Tyr) deacylase [Deltaproteobacteria bacterium]
MRAVVQRVSQASVTVSGELCGAIGTGLLVLLGAAQGDDGRDVDLLVRKIVGLRIFRDEAGQMNRSVQEIGGALLVVSQFTLLGDCRRGRRPSFSAAMEPVQAERLCQLFVEQARAEGVAVATGRFGAMMDVALVNDGPVTLLLDSKKLF